MNVAMISCFMRTSYGAYANSLCRAIEPFVGRRVQIISTNCGCGDPVAREPVLYGPGSRYFAFPNIGIRPRQPESSALYPYEYKARLAAGRAVYWARARIYSNLSKGADIVHFQQVLGAYGSRALFHWIAATPTVRKVVTVHELDQYQLSFREKNRLYNMVDAITVHFAHMKDQLVGLGVDEDRIHIVHCGTDLFPRMEADRSDIIYYGGHHFTEDKGIEVLLKAFKRIIEEKDFADLQLKIHGHYGERPPQQIVDLVSLYDLDDHVAWLNDIDSEEMTRQYATSLFLVLPFKGSFAGHVATRAMACGLPVIATKDAGLPDHLGDLGIYVNVGDDVGLEARMLDLLTQQATREDLALRLRKRAEESYSWQTIAGELVEIYEEVLSA